MVKAQMEIIQLKVENTRLEEREKDATTALNQSHHTKRAAISWAYWTRNRGKFLTLHIILKTLIRSLQ